MKLLKFYFIWALLSLNIFASSLTSSEFWSEFKNWFKTLFIYLFAYERPSMKSLTDLFTFCSLFLFISSVYWIPFTLFFSSSSILSICSRAWAICYLAEIWSLIYESMKELIFYSFFSSISLLYSSFWGALWLY